MVRRLVLTSVGLALLAAISFALPASSAAADTPRISPEVLKALLGNSEVVVIDVRRGKDWEGSATKIKGAVRESEKDINWAGRYAKDKLLVLYCA
jgi:rhodanese-related sulfurtransferase